LTPGTSQDEDKTSDGATPSEVELVEMREVELRIGTSSIQLSKDDELTEVKFSEILRTFVQDESFYVEGKWSSGPTLQGLVCSSPQEAKDVKTATKQAVASRLAAVHASINLQQAKAKKVFSRKSGNLVLAVDSTTKFQARVTKLLLMAGQTVTFATDGFEALDKYKKSPGRFSMIFTEIELTDDMSGWKLTRDVRQFEEQEGLPRTPIFAMTKLHWDHTNVDTGSKNKEEKSSNLCHSEAAGMDGYLMKPPTRHKLRALLVQYLNARRTTGATQGGNMTDPVHTGHGQEEYFDEALAEFYAKEHWFPKLFFLPFYITRKFMLLFWWGLACYGYTFGKRDVSKSVIIF